MTRDELIAISTQELGKLPADELVVIVSHFGTEDRAELARRLADEAEEAPRALAMKVSTAAPSARASRCSSGVRCSSAGSR